MEHSLTVVIPVGPLPRHAEWLPEAMDSVRAQTVSTNLLVVDDMHGLECSPATHRLSPRISGSFEGDHWYILWPAPWRLGVAGAFNAGVALAPTKLALMLGADDILAPDAAEAALEAYNGCTDADPDDVYWYLPVRYMDTGEVQNLPCGAAVVSKEFWRRSGGFPPEAAVGASDTMLLSCILAQRNRGGPLHWREVGDGRPLYDYRRHAGTDTAERGPWQHVIWDTREILTGAWRAPEWGRYA